MITPRLNDNGQYYTAFNAAALSEISTATRHCDTTFKSIENLLKQAFQGVPQIPSSVTKVELSKIEKLKWPMLQPEFEELRQDLQQSKINLSLMVAVAQLAFLQNGGKQRPVDANERMELKGTVLGLQRAGLTSVKREASTVNNANKDGMIKKMFQKLGTSKNPKEVASEKQLPLETTYNRSNKSHHSTENTLAAKKLASSVRELNNNQVAKNASEEKSSAPTNDQTASTTPGQTAPSGQADKVAESEADTSLNAKHTTGDSISDAEQAKLLYAWTTSVLPGLSTGLERSVDIHPLDMPQEKLQEMVDESLKKDMRPLEVVYKLNAYQRRLVLEHIAARRSALLYLGTWHHETIPSVFGNLDVTILIWITRISSTWLYTPKENTAGMSSADRLRQRLSDQRSSAPGLTQLWDNEDEVKRMSDPNSSLRSGAKPNWRKLQWTNELARGSSAKESPKIILGFRPVKPESHINHIKDMMGPGTVANNGNLEKKSEEDVIVDELLSRWTGYDETRDPI